MKPLTLLKQIMALPLLLIWTTGSLWALLFGMTLTGTFGLVGIPFILQPWLPKPFNPRWLLTVSLVLPVCIFMTGPIEYHRQSRIFHCRALQTYHTEQSDIPNWCPAEYQQQIDDFRPIQLYKSSERMGIWFHHLGEILWHRLHGKNRYAIQRWKMMWTIHPQPSIQLAMPHSKRSICRSTGPINGTTTTHRSNALLSTNTVQQVLQEHTDSIASLPNWSSFSTELANVPYPETLSSGLHPMASLHLSFTSRAQRWIIKQPIVYTPRTWYVIEIPSIVGYLKIPLSTAMYCGLQMDGLLSPYREEYDWTESNLNSPTNITNILTHRK